MSALEPVEERLLEPRTDRVLDQHLIEQPDAEPDEAERDIAEAIAEMRAEERAKRAAAPRP